MPDQPPTPKAALTEYVILKQHIVTPPTSGSSAAPARATEQWDRVAQAKARSAEHAIRQHAEKNAVKDGVYIAIPNRSWTPLTVKAQVQTTLTIAPA